MAIQLTVWERRDGGDRATMGNTALELCRVVRKLDGISSSRFYWTGVDNIVVLNEGETVALDNAGQVGGADYVRLAFVMADNARIVMNARLTDPRDAIQTYRTAGRIG